MPARYFALLFGLTYLVVGLVSFIPLFLEPADPAPTFLLANGLYGELFGLFPVNWIHNLVHIGLGAWGISSFKSVAASRYYARGLALIFGVLTILGVFTPTSTLLGIAPLYGHNVWLHALSSLLAAPFGFLKSAARTRGSEAWEDARRMTTDVGGESAKARNYDKVG